MYKNVFVFAKKIFSEMDNIQKPAGAPMGKVSLPT